MKAPSKLIRVGHSPDPDDAFMFYALAHEKIDMRGFKVEHVIEDIESLNQRALNQGVGCRILDDAEPKASLSSSVIRSAASGFLEVTAVSCHAYAYLADKYTVMRSGASVGDKYGPILVATSHKVTKTQDEKDPRVTCGVCHAAKPRIAVPGKLTTAHLVLQLYLKSNVQPQDFALRTPYEFTFVPFDKVFDAVKSGDADYGLVIHEGQITFAEHGLEKVLDLGEWWSAHTGGLPLPLGVDVIRKDLGEETMRKFAVLFKQSIEYALNHRKEALEYAGQFGRGISNDLNDRFVAMYVNERTLDIGIDGEAGFRRLLDEAFAAKIIPKKVILEFI